MSNAGFLARNFTILFSGNVIGQFLFFVATLYLARVFGPAAFGIWSFAQVWQLYLLRLGEFGLEVTAIREVARKPETAGLWIGSVVFLRALLSIALCLATLLAVKMNLVPHDSSKAVLLFSLAVIPAAFMLEWVFEARLNVVVTSFARVAKGVLFGLGVALFVRENADFANSVLVYIVSVALPVATVFPAAVRSFGFELSSFSVARVWGMIRSASEVGVANILSHYSLFIGAMMVGYISAETDLGLFSAAHRVVVLPWAYVFVSFQRVLLPTLSKWHLESKRYFETFVEKFFRYTVIASFAIGLTGTLFGSALVNLLYSAAYAKAAEVFVVLLWALAFAGMRFIFEIALIASDDQRRYLKGMILLVVLYTIITPLLTSTHGIVGAAWAGVISEFTYFLYLAITFPHLRAARLLRHIWKPLAACSLAALTGLTLGPVHVAIQGVLVLSAFFVFLLVSKAVSCDDLRTILQLVRSPQNITGDTPNRVRFDE